ncbi:hypothetical protein M9H77_19799 [Catharanthus roseus]|uniref:Uncharacterized protein n=1 Tax=Catharanthus roseus TaxID=4058 RepID=A0ACC0BBB8_CATRO|nr:hypothetical protein M9H77_19799 [Catharanthus roseus]
MKMRRDETLFPSVIQCSLNCRKSQTLVCDFSSLLRSESYFPYFMLVAFEGGSILRAFFLLLSYPLLFFLNYELQMKFMIFITFCGLRFKDIDLVSRAVLPKFYLENLNYLVYKILASCGSKKVFTIMPRVMVEGFLKEYIKVDTVKGTELHSIGKYYTGFLSNSGLLVKHRALKEQFGEKIPDIGIGSISSLHRDKLFLSFSKEAYVVKKEDRKASTITIMPREKYPKPLIFHDGRLAFLPTPLASLTMFMWLPLGVLLVFFRFFVVIFLPPKLAIFMISLSGVVLKFNLSKLVPKEKGKSGDLYVGNHRNLLDPIILSLALEKPLTAVTYSLSRFSELLSPIRTKRLTRDRNQDAKTIVQLLGKGDLVVFPEGTTCREPYVLRFSSLFAELTEHIVPVAFNFEMNMFYPTTASGLKWLDAIFGAMNPRPYCSVEILDKVPKERTVGGGRSSHEVANYVQKKIADALGFESTNLTRRDKYLMLAGNEGAVYKIKERNSKT